MAIAAMVLGIVALVLSFIPLIAILTFLLGPLAVVLGILALVKRRGRGQAITGIVTGGLGVLIATIGFLIFSALIASGDDDSQQNERDPDVSAQESPASSEDEKQMAKRWRSSQQIKKLKKVAQLAKRTLRNKTTKASW